MHCLVMDSRYRQVNHSHPSPPHPAPRDHRDYNLNFTAPSSGTKPRKTANLVHVAMNSGPAETLTMYSHTCTVTTTLLNTDALLRLIANGFLVGVVLCIKCTETSLSSQFSTDTPPHDSILQAYDSSSVDIKAWRFVSFVSFRMIYRLCHSLPDQHDGLNMLAICDE